MSKKVKLVILDRDGVINIDSVEYIKSPEEWHAIPGSIAAIARLTNAGYKIVIVTNQSGIARGYFSLGQLNAIHDKMLREIRAFGGNVAEVFVCPHGPEDNCGCRKPRPGLLWQVSEKFAILPENSILVGDSLRDLQAAEAFGCEFALVLTGNGQYTLETTPTIDKKHIYRDLSAFVDGFLSSN